MLFALLQIDTTVGALDDNADKLREHADRALALGARLIVGPELALSGYPPRDLILQEGFVLDCERAVRRMAESWTHDAPLVVGTPWHLRDRDNRPAGTLNALAVLRNGLVETVYAKRLLPTYDVFDEARHFTPGNQPCVIDVDGTPVGLAICEDLWRGGDIVDASDGEGRYADRDHPMVQLYHAGAKIMVVASASPYTHDKLRDQRRIVASHAERFNTIVASANLVGANDDLVFAGASVACVPKVGPVACAKAYEEDVLLVDTESRYPAHDPLDDTAHEEHLYRALVLGVRSYFEKVRTRRAVLGVSGGIDSALVAVLAVRALGPENVIALAMPSRYSSDHSIEDARDLCERLATPYQLVPIAPMHDVVEATTTPLFHELGLDEPPGVAEENVQSRLRGLTIMAVANKANAIALATGNKSELAVGYCTLYGDMNGGLAPISDVLKTDVYRLSRWINDHHQRAGFDAPPIPESTIEKPPSAELRPGQLDQDSLPPYDVLDEIIHRYVEQRQHPARIATETGFDRETVAWVCRTTDRNEHKRKQMPIGLKVSPIAFGRGRRRPLAQAWDHSRPGTKGAEKREPGEAGAV